MTKSSAFSRLMFSLFPRYSMVESSSSLSFSSVSSSACSRVSSNPTSGGWGQFEPRNESKRLLSLDSAGEGPFGSLLELKKLS